MTLHEQEVITGLQILHCENMQICNCHTVQDTDTDIECERTATEDEGNA